MFRFLKTASFSPFSPKPEDIIKDFIEVNKTVNENGKDLPLSESEIRKELLDPIKEIDNIKNDNKQIETTEKYVHYKSIYNTLQSRYNSTRDAETLALLKEYRTFLKTNFKEQYEMLEKQYPDAWKISE